MTEFSLNDLIEQLKEIFTVFSLSCQSHLGPQLTGTSLTSFSALYITVYYVFDSV